MASSISFTNNKQTATQNLFSNTNLPEIKGNQTRNIGLDTQNVYSRYRTDKEREDSLDAVDGVLHYSVPTLNEIAEETGLFASRSWDVTPSVNSSLGGILRSAYQSAQSVEDLKSWELASIVSDVTGVDINYAKRNMTDLIKVYTGKDIDEASFASGLWESAKSKVMSNITGIRAKVLNATLVGKSEREKQLAIENFMNNELSKTSVYWNPDMYGYRDNVLGKTIYFMAENSSDVVESFITGLLTGGVGHILKLGSTAVKVVDKIIRVASVYEKESGSALLGFWQATDANGNRMDWATMSSASSLIGVVNTAFEFGLETTLDKIGVKTIQRLSSVSNLFTKYGKMSSKSIMEAGIETTQEYLKKGLKQNAKNALGEGLTEAMQSWSELFFSNLAYKKSEGFGDYVKSNKDILSEMAEVFALTATTTFLEAPILNSIGGNSDDGFSLLGYARDTKSGKIVNINQATKYSRQTDGSTLVSMQNILRTNNEAKVKDLHLTEVPYINVYKVGNKYIPASKTDSMIIGGARGNTAGIYVNVVEGSVEGTPYNVESFTAQRSLGIQNKNIVGTSGNTVVVKKDNLATTVTNFMTSDNFVSAQFKQDGQVSTNGQFNEATITLKDSNGENRNIRIVTEDIATKENLTLKDYNQADREANEQFAKDVQERNEKNLNETVKEAKKYTPQELNEVFDKRTSTLSQEDKTATKSLRNKIYKILRQKKDDKNMSIRQATALANTSSTLVQTMASVNKMSVSQFVKERVGDNVADFIKIMTTEEKLANGNNPAFIVQNTDGTWTINLWLGDNTQSNLIHELGHMFVSTITDDSVLDEFKALYKNEFEEGGIMGEKFQERFCDDLEAYIASGKAQNEGLRAVFKQIVSAMTDFVKYIRGIEFNNKESVIRAFDNLFNVDTVENIQRVEDTDTALASIKETLTSSSTQLKNEIGEDSETINDLVSDINTTIDQLQDESTSENEKAQLWRELNDKAETLREELDSVEGEAVNSIREALSKESLANLMNNRPIASQQKYNKNIDVYNRYRNEVDNSRTQMNMEANPSIEIDLLKGYHSDVPSDTNSKEYKQWLKQRKDFAVDITKALRDKNGEDIINKKVGLKTVKFGDKDYNHGVGIYYGSDGKRQASIGQQDFIKPEYDEKGNLTAEFCDKMDLSCLLHAIVLRQDAVTWGKYEESASESDGNAIVFDVGENVPMDKANNLIKELENECKKRGLKDLGSFCFIPNNEGFAINNFTWGAVSNAEFQKVIIEIVDSWVKKNYNENVAGRIVSYGSGVSKNGGYVSIELEDAKNGFGNVKRDFGKNEKDVLWEVRNELLSNGFQEVYEKFSKIWGNAGTVPTGDPEIDAFISSLSRENREAWTRKESEILVKKDKTLKNKTGAVYFGNIAKKAGIKVSDTTGVRYNKLVYHGSGARFDAFDSDYMGTGEGGASKGAGQYMTDEEGRRYRKNVDTGDLDFTYYGSVLVPYKFESNNGSKETA